MHFTFPLILVIFGGQAWMEGSFRDAIETIVFILAAFLCVVLHEFGHSFQVRRYGIVVRDIILLPIGGMARAEKIPDNPWQEIVVAISGPIVNFAIAAVLFALTVLRGVPLWGDGDFIVNMLFINLALGLFNLIPAFPMDGGRILRGILALKLPYLKATRYAKAVGQFIALVFVVIGFTSSWFMLPVIAVFIFFGANNEEEMLRVRSILGGKRLRDLVSPDDPPVLTTDSVGSVRSRFARGSRRAVVVSDPVVGRAGVLMLDAVADAMKAHGADYPVGPLVSSDVPVLGADMSAVQVYYFLKAERLQLVCVADSNENLGVLETATLLSDSS